MRHRPQRHGSHTALRFALGITPHQRPAPPRTRYAPISEDRAQILVRALEKIELLGGEEKALLADLSHKIDTVAKTCTVIRKHLEAREGTLPSSKIVPMESLEQGFTLRRPIYAVVEHSDGIVTATYYECEVFGEGETEFESLDDLRRCLVEYYCQLRGSSESLGPLPARHLRILSDLIQAEQG